MVPFVRAVSFSANLGTVEAAERAVDAIDELLEWSEPLGEAERDDAIDELLDAELFEELLDDFEDLDELEELLEDLGDEL